MVFLKNIFGRKTMEIEQKKVRSDSTAYDTAKAEAIKILNERIDEHVADFQASSEALFDVGNKVIVNKYGIGKSESNSWDGGAVCLLSCIKSKGEIDKPIYAEITSVRVTTGYASDCLDRFLDSLGFDVIKEVKSRCTIIYYFDRYLKFASKISDISMKYGVYWEYGFTTNAEFNPSWGLNGDAFHFTSTKEGKATLEIWEKELEATKLQDEATKLQDEATKLREDNDSLKRKTRYDS